MCGLQTRRDCLTNLWPVHAVPEGEAGRAEGDLGGRNEAGTQAFRAGNQRIRGEEGACRAQPGWEQEQALNPRNQLHL